MREGSWRRLKAWLREFKTDHAGQPRSLGFGGWLCFAMRGIGVFLFGTALAAFSLPLLVGASWTETIIVVAVGLMVSRQFLQFQYLYLEVEAFVMYAWDHLVRSRSWEFYWNEELTAIRARQTSGEAVLQG